MLKLYYSLLYSFKLVKLMMGSSASFPIVPLTEDRLFIITGASSGLGYEIAKWCAMMGATVILACRSEQKTKEVIKRMNKEFQEEKEKGTTGLSQKERLAVEFMHLELSSFKSVVSFTEEFKKSRRKLHVLFLNAGFGLEPYSKTEDGLESTLQVNYLSHFLMVSKLLPIMKNSGDDCRLLLMSSLGHRLCSFDVNEINYTGTPNKFSQDEYYCKSKLYQVMQVLTMAKRLKDTNVSINCVNPGFVYTDFGKERSGLWYVLLPAAKFTIGKKVVQAAKSGINCAVNPDLKGVTGQYFNRECKTELPSVTARNETFQQQLWEETFKFLKDFITEEDRAVMEGVAGPI